MFTMGNNRLLPTGARPNYGLRALMRLAFTRGQLWEQRMKWPKTWRSSLRLGNFRWVRPPTATWLQSWKRTVMVCDNLVREFHSL